VTKLLQFEELCGSDRCAEQHMTGGKLHLDRLAFGGVQGDEYVGLRQGA